MAKRFTDSRKWDDPWFRKLPLKYKMFWIFILDKCNHAGIYKVDMDVATFFIGDEIKEKEASKYFRGRIVKVDGHKWYIPKFVGFQYPHPLSPQNNAHKGVIKELEKYNLDPSVGQGRPSTDSQVKVKVKEQVKVKDNIYKHTRKVKRKHDNQRTVDEIMPWRKDD